MIYEYLLPFGRLSFCFVSGFFCSTEGFYSDIVSFCFCSFCFPMPVETYSEVVAKMDLKMCTTDVFTSWWWFKVLHWSLYFIFILFLCMVWDSGILTSFFFCMQSFILTPLLEGVIFSQICVTFTEFEIKNFYFKNIKYYVQFVRYIRYNMR